MSPEENPVPVTGTGRKRRLSREIVLSAALALVDAEGLDALTMRRLGQERGRDPMGLYLYAANRAALLDCVAELVLNKMPITPEDPDWQAYLRRIDHDLRFLALRHPNVVSPFRDPPPLRGPGHPAAGNVAATEADPAPADQRLLQPGRFPPRLPRLLRVPAPGISILLSGLAPRLPDSNRQHIPARETHLKGTHNVSTFRPQNHPPRPARTDGDVPVLWQVCPASPAGTRQQIHPVLHSGSNNIQNLQHHLHQLRSELNGQIETEEGPPQLGHLS